MKVGTIGFVLLMSLLPPFSTVCGESGLEADLTATGALVDVGGNEAKFNEYRDLRDAVYGDVRLRYDKEKYSLTFEGRDFGYDTQSYQLEAGMWGKFGVDAYYKELPHNVTFNAKSFYSGIGSNHLQGSPNTDVSSWNTFDYSTQRKQLGGGFRVDLLKPFYFSASIMREEKEGIKPAGVSVEDADGIALELPEPIGFTTDRLVVEAGFAKRPVFLALNYFYSDFNQNNVLHFQNPETGQRDIMTLPPDDHYYRLALKGAIKLPLRTTLSTNLGAARTKSEHPSFSTFRGKIDNRNYDIVLSSNPIRLLDAKLYYKYYKRDNQSTEAQDAAIELLDYKKNTFGAGLGLRLPSRFHLTGGYKYVKTKRWQSLEADGVTGATPPVPEELLAAALPFNDDNIYTAELRWQGLDFMILSGGYERLDRRADYRDHETRVQRNQQFCYAAQDRDTYKAGIEIFPIDPLSIGAEYKYITTRYDRTILGLRDDKRDAVDVSADYAIGKYVRLFAYFDYELIKLDQKQRTPDDEDWRVKQRDETYGYGLGTEIHVIPEKLSFRLWGDYLKANGRADYPERPDGVTGATPMANRESVDISAWDDYTRWGLKLSASYSLTKYLMLSAGYAYEKFDYSDAQLNHYEHVPATSGTNGAYLTGAYKDQSYDAHVVFGSVTIRN